MTKYFLLLVWFFHQNREFLTESLHSSDTYDNVMLMYWRVYFNTCETYVLKYNF